LNLQYEFQGKIFKRAEILAYKKAAKLQFSDWGYCRFLHPKNPLSADFYDFRCAHVR
jgi:hypothetical protein